MSCKHTEWTRNLILGVFACLLLALEISPAAARSMAEIRKSKELRICMVAYNPSFVRVEPETCRENCKWSGLVYDQALAFTKSLGTQIRPKFSRLEWDEQFFNKDAQVVRAGSYTPEAMASGKCDLYPSNLTKNAWRLNKLDLVVLFPSRLMVIINKAKKNQFRTVADLAGKVTAVNKDSSYHTWIQEQNQTTFLQQPVKIELMLLADSYAAVDANQVDFSLSDSDLAISAIRHQYKNSIVAFPVGPTEEIGWGFRKQDKDLQAAAQAFFDAQKMDEQSEFNQIWQKHLGISLIKFMTLVKSTQ